MEELPLTYSMYVVGCRQRRQALVPECDGIMVYEYGSPHIDLVSHARA